MSRIRALFWDIGGVLLTNAWDHNERAKALERFQLDPAEFHMRHEALVPGFERGQITLDEYLDRTVFHQQRSFTRDSFRDYMVSLSQPVSGMVQFAQAIASSGKYFMGTINNESRELNEYRIEKFEFRKIFRLFVSSCFVGLRKPDREIYRLALEVTQFPAEECCFIDDRAENLEWPSKLGMYAVQMKGLDPLRAELQKVEVTI